jgi:hypothetical protein
MKVYTGIGSRETPGEILRTMTSIAQRLSNLGWTLRSGNAPGADQAFALGTEPTQQHIFLPWPTFEADFLETWGIVPIMRRPGPGAEKIAERFHPRWASLGNGARMLHARNVHQILGPNAEDPIVTKFVICWTPGGEGGGGTGQALRIARSYGVPIFDLARPEDYERVTTIFASEREEARMRN